MTRTVEEIMADYLAHRVAGPKLSKKAKRRASDADRALREEKQRRDAEPMDRDEILRGIEAMQAVQRANPPSSEKWQRASRVLHGLVKQLTGKYPQDACGRS